VPVVGTPRAAPEAGGLPGGSERPGSERRPKGTRPPSAPGEGGARRALARLRPSKATMERTPTGTDPNQPTSLSPI
jgi:hypothetical protein